MSDNELGLFLRIRREAVPPAQVGLPAGARRRTPGLRRSELATLAGVSVEYITRLEQGRDRHPSSAVLAALSDALGMTSTERVYLHRLAKAQSPGFTCNGTMQPTRVVRPAVLAILDQLEPAPAAVVNRASEIVACTAGYRRLMGPTGLFDEGEPANFARYIFTDPRAREAHPDWEHTADKVVANLKVGPFRSDPVVSALVDELTLTAGPEFSGRLSRISGLPEASRVDRLIHPEVGLLRLAFESLELSADDDQRLIVQLPADDATAEALDRLIGRKPGSLRAVAG
ncbi:helix-turn-helix domain-containing protein [Nocardia sp.]|uniref:helix-turn-helix domain-containing protein n=1 Tax=Nocardia sp. TaxID=1821 RepID=UPI0026389F47|nr:helix-turn-helix transcriptional regulator [Nocardia sp.]